MEAQIFSYKGTWHASIKMPDESWWVLAVTGSTREEIENPLKSAGVKVVKAPGSLYEFLGSVAGG